MYVSGSPYGDEGGQELRWREKQIERGKQQEGEGERERERECTGSRDQQCPHSGFVYTGALLNSVAFKQTEREKGVTEHAGVRGIKREREREREKGLRGRVRCERYGLNAIYIIRA